MNDPYAHWAGQSRHPSRIGQGMGWGGRGRLFSAGAVLGWLHGLLTGGRRML